MDAEYEMRPVVVATLQMLVQDFGMTPIDAAGFLVQIASAWSASEIAASQPQWKHYSTDGYTFDLRSDGNGGLQIGREPLT